MSRWVTGSSLDRAAQCPGSVVLPRAQVAEGSAARHGKRIHKLLETGQPIPGLDPAKQAEWYPPGGFHEVQYYYDPVFRTGGLNFEAKGRDYSWAAPHWVVGTLDYIHPAFPLGQERGLLVDDLKTGRWAPELDTLQLGAGALAGVLTFKPGLVAVSITHVPRGSEANASRNLVELSPLDISHVQETLDGAYARMLADNKRLDMGAAVGVNRGPWCKYCPAKRGCPAW